MQAITPFLDLDLAIGNKRVVIPIESSVLRTTRRLSSPHIWLLVGGAYVVLLSFIVRAQWFLVPSDAWLDCTSAFWAAEDQCGLQGQLCEPFQMPPISFRCPPLCKLVTLQNYRTVGNEQVIFEPLIVGGGDANKTYRGDSFICATAVQACVIFLAAFRYEFPYSLTIETEVYSAIRQAVAYP